MKTLILSSLLSCAISCCLSAQVKWVDVQAHGQLATVMSYKQIFDQTFWTETRFETPSRASFVLDWPKRMIYGAGIAAELALPYKLGARVELYYMQPITTASDFLFHDFGFFDTYTSTKFSQANISLVCTYPLHERLNLGVGVTILNQIGTASTLTTVYYGALASTEVRTSTDFPTYTRLYPQMRLASNWGPVVVSAAALFNLNHPQYDPDAWLSSHFQFSIGYRLRTAAGRQ